jgi:hypothetical protein
MMTNNSRPLYSEDEAATMLGVSVNQLRSLVKTHIVKEDSVTAFQSTDLLILKILSRNADTFAPGSSAS